jgi:glycosyltransferase involved in cell wall biosynthesis
MAKNNTVYVLSPDNDKPAGGIKILYRHVDVLSRNGFSAAVLHQQRGFRCRWFDNDTPIVYLPDIRLSDTDYLVIPEIYGPNIPTLGDLPQIGRTVRKVIFNQNCRYTYLGQTVESVLAPAFRMPYQDSSEYVATIVVSEDSAAYLQYVFPGHDVYRIHNAIDVERFAFREDKKRQICFMPRKHPEDAIQVLGILRARGVLDGVRVVAIENQNESGVAAIMGESLLFLSFGYPEGCPLPPAEAMACGCIVAGYHGFGGREYFRRDFAYPVDAGDITGYAAVVEALLKESAENPQKIARQARQGAGFIREQYSAERESRDIVSCWNRIQGGRDAG